MGLAGSNIFEREALAEIRVNAGRTWEAGGGTNVSLLGNPASRKACVERKWIWRHCSLETG